jgi:hypothetical protein
VTDWLSTAVSLPADALKAIGTVLVGALLAVGTYVLSRIREVRKPADAVAPGLPRLALDPADRDLGYTLVRTATDLTRALNDHADALANLPAPGCAAPTAPPHHRSRNRRHQP